MATGSIMAAPGADGADVRVRLRCWGDFAVTDVADGSDLRPRGRKARALLAYLALHPGRPVSRERLAGLLWGDRGEEQARASLRQAIQELKPLANGHRNLLVVERDHVMLKPAALVTDIDEIRAASERGDFAALVAALPEQEERLFANLDDVDEDFDGWLAIERTRRREALITLIADASAAAVTYGQTRHARALHARAAEFAPHRSAMPPPAPAVPAAVEPIADAARAPASNPTERTTGRLRHFAVIGTLMLALGALAVGAWQRIGAPAPPATIAVLPFKNLSSGTDDAFAEGLSEEISAQLARQPNLRIAARTLTSRLENRAADLEDLGRKLGVSYVLEGSVRSAGQRVRVNVALAEASDGIQLWSETFDGTLEDILAIQARIGAQVAATLQQRLARGGRSAAGPATSGAVYTAYLTARTLIRERNVRAMTLAKGQLERAVALDPSFAPAWSSLAQTKLWSGTMPGRTPEEAQAEALADARRALVLAPDLAEAHAVLGIVLGLDEPEGRRHILRAVALDPDNAEYQYWLANAHADAPDFVGMQRAYARAFQLDPLWVNAYANVAQYAWHVGDRAAALSAIERVNREGSRYDGRLARGFLASYSGDYSTAIEELRLARAISSDVGKQAIAAYSRMALLANLGFVAEARHEYITCKLSWYKEQKRPLDLPRPYLAHVALAHGRLPSPPQFAGAAGASPPHIVRETAERLINAGRAREVVALYDSQQGLLSLSSRRTPDWRWQTVEAVPVVAAALQAVGRGVEANGLLSGADRLIQDALGRARGRTPAPFHAQAAQVWALLGKKELALTSLDTALRNGWFNGDLLDGDLVDDIGAEPAFESLRGDPRFEAMRARTAANLARERREVARQLARTA